MRTAIGISTQIGSKTIGSSVSLLVAVLYSWMMLMMMNDDDDVIWRFLFRKRERISYTLWILLQHFIVKVDSSCICWWPQLWVFAVNKKKCGWYVASVLLKGKVGRCLYCNPLSYDVSILAVIKRTHWKGQLPFFFQHSFLSVIVITTTSSFITYTFFLFLPLPSSRVLRGHTRYVVDARGERSKNSDDHKKYQSPLRHAAALVFFQWIFLSHTREQKARRWQEGDLSRGTDFFWCSREREFSLCPITRTKRRRAVKENECDSMMTSYGTEWYARGGWGYLWQRGEHSTNTDGTFKVCW